MEQIFCPPRRFHYIYYFCRKTIFVDGMCEVDGERKIIAIPTKREERRKFQSHAPHRLPPNAFVYKQQASLTKGSRKVSFACVQIYVIALRLEKWLQKNLNIQKTRMCFWWSVSAARVSTGGWESSRWSVFGRFFMKVSF